MPAYEYACAACGPFELRRDAAHAGAEVACPRCSAPGRRVWRAPGVRRTLAWQRAALGREERSAHEPEVVTRPSGRPLPHAHAHRPAPPWVLAGH